MDALVIGLPINMDGSEGRRCQSVRQFAANLLARRDLPTAFWDERLSTAAVTRTMIEADLSRRKRAAAVDRLAAAYILEGALAAASQPCPKRLNGEWIWEETSDASSPATTRTGRPS